MASHLSFARYLRWGTPGYATAAAITVDCSAGEANQEEQQQYDVAHSGAEKISRRNLFEQTNPVFGRTSEFAKSAQMCASNRRATFWRPIASTWS